MLGILELKQEEACLPPTAFCFFLIREIIKGEQRKDGKCRVVICFLVNPKQYNEACLVKGPMRPFERDLLAENGLENANVCT